MAECQTPLPATASGPPTAPSASTMKRPDEWLHRLAQSRNRAQLHVAFVLRTVPPYRLPFLTALSSASPLVRISVITADALNEKGKLITISTSGAFRLLRVKGVQFDIWKYTLIWMHGCRRVLDDLDCDVLVLEGSFGILSHLPLALWAKRNGKGVVFWTSGWNKPTMTGLAMRLRGAYLRGAMRLGDHFVCYSTAAAAWLGRMGVPSSRVTVGQNTIDVEGIAAKRLINRERARRLRTNLAIEDAPVVVYVGALTRDKHVERLVALHEALRRRGIPLHTVVVGDGPARQDIAAAAKMMQGFHIMGRVTDEVDVLFAVGDVFVLPGLGGLAINQAMANGIPVLCTQADGTERDLVIEGVTGYYRPEFVLEEWTELLYELLSDSDRRRQMGEAARAHVLGCASLQAMCVAFLRGIGLALGRCTPQAFSEHSDDLVAD